MFPFSDSSALQMRGFMICFHQVHDFMPLTGPNATGVKMILQEMQKVRLNTLLIEYETMFPWNGENNRISCAEKFTEEDIASIRTAAQKNSIEIIPLVQVLGHVYHILIHSEYADCAEDKEIPQQLCPLSDATRKLAVQLIDDTLRQHPGARYIHLGGDECEQLGQCPRCSAFMKKYGKGALFTDYMHFVTDYALSKGVTPILWHDVALCHPECLKQFDSRVVFLFWNYGDASHGSMEKPLHQLLKEIPPQRIIGGPGARTEIQNGALHFNPALQETDIAEMNSLMSRIGALGTILTDWPDTGCSFFDSLYAMRAQAAAAWNGGDIPVGFRREYARQVFGVDIPELPAYLDAIAGVTLFARGFLTRMTHPLNRYARGNYDFAAELNRLKADYFKADGEEELYRLVGRYNSAQHFARLLSSLKNECKSNKCEWAWLQLLVDVTIMFLELDIGVRKECFTLKYFSDPSPEIWEQFQSRVYLSRALEKWDSVKTRYIELHKEFVSGGMLSRSANELWSQELYKGALELLNS